MHTNLTWHYISIIPCALCCRKRALCSDKMLSLQALICSGRLPVIYTQFDGTARFFTAANLWQVLSLQKKTPTKSGRYFCRSKLGFYAPVDLRRKRSSFRWRTEIDVCRSNTLMWTLPLQNAYFAARTKKTSLSLQSLKVWRRPPVIVKESGSGSGSGYCKLTGTNSGYIRQLKTGESTKY